MKQKTKETLLALGLCSALIGSGFIAGRMTSPSIRDFGPNVKSVDMSCIIQHLEGNEWKSIMELRGELGMLRICAPSTEVSSLKLRLIQEDESGKSYPIYF